MTEATDTDRGSDLEAIGLIVVAMIAFAAQDTVVKLVADDISLWQMQAVRSLAVIVLLAVYAWARGRAWAMFPRRRRWPLIRACFMAGAYLFFYSSLPFLTLSQAAAAFFTGPLLITLFAALLLGEPIGPRRIVAVAVGFVGVLLIVRPGVEGWTPIALLPVGAALCYALGVVITRWRCSGEPAEALAMTHNLLYAAIGAVAVIVVPMLPISPEIRAASPFLFEGWLPLGWVALALLITTAWTHMLGNIASVTAYHKADASRIAPFEYTYLAIVPLIDIALFGTVPQMTTFYGMGLIIAAGSFVAWREGRPARARVVAIADTPWTPDAEDGREAR